MSPVIARDSIDGVTVLHADVPGDTTLAALIFGVGRFDETLPASGITHMVEHLTLTGKTEAPYSFNASVSGRYTTFMVQASHPDQVREYVADVCQGLRADQSAALDRERRILRTEAASRGGAGALGTCLSERYGATGPGLANYQEFGLHHLNWYDVLAWRSRWFTSGNAVLCIAGPVPDGLRVDLPIGLLPEHQPLRPLDQTLPGFVAAGRGGLGLSLVGERSAGSYACTDVLQRRLTQVLRHELGVSYHVQASFEELSDGQTHVWLAADSLPDQVAALSHAMLGTFEALVDEGCTETELKAYAERLGESYNDSLSGVAAILQRQAHAVLNRQAWTPEKTLNDAAGLSPAATRQIARGLYDSMIVAAPSAPPALSGRMARLPLWSAAAVAGIEYKAADSGAVLTSGPDGVTLTPEPRHYITVRYADCVALLRWTDGKQTIVGSDGFAVQLDPGEWPEGQAALAGIAGHVRPDLIVAMDGPGPSRPVRATAADRETPASPPTAAPTATAPAPARSPKPPARRLSWPARILRAVWTVVGIFGLLAIAGGDISGGVAFLVIGLAGLGWMEFRRRRNV
jgi:zinc protease